MTHLETLKLLRFDLLDALGFAELVEAVAKPDVEVYKHELRGDSERAQRRLLLAIERVDKAIKDNS